MKKTNKRKLNKAGYTLVELLVVVTIIAIFTGFSTIGLRVVQNRNISKYSRMVNEIISDFYKNATTKEGNWKMEMKLLSDDKTYQFTQYYEAEENGVKVWKPYFTESINGNLVYAVETVELNNCKCRFYKNRTLIPVEGVTPRPVLEIYVSRERAVFDKAKSTVDTIVFTNGSVSSQLNIVLGTPNNYIGTP